MNEQPPAQPDTTTPTVEVEVDCTDNAGMEMVEATPGALALRLLTLLVEQGVVRVDLLNQSVNLHAGDAVSMSVYGDFNGDRWQDAVRLLGIVPELMHDERL